MHLLGLHRPLARLAALTLWRLSVFWPQKIVLPDVRARLSLPSVSKCSLCRRAKRQSSRRRRRHHQRHATSSRSNPQLYSNFLDICLPGRSWNVCVSHTELPSGIEPPLWLHCLSLQVVEKAPQVEEEDSSEEVSCNGSSNSICIQIFHSLGSSLTLWTALRRLLTRKRSYLHQLPHPSLPSLLPSQPLSQLPGLRPRRSRPRKR